MRDACRSEIRGICLLEWQGLGTFPVVHAGDMTDCAPVAISAVAAAAAHRPFGQNLRAQAAAALDGDGFAGNVCRQIAREEHGHAADVGFRVAETS